MTVLSALVIAGSVLASVLGLLRWLRVAQREHYLPGSVLRFVKRWWGKDVINAAIGVSAIAAAIASGFSLGAGFAAAALVAVGPLGLGLRGRSAKLAWTRRLRTIAGIAGLEVAIATVVAGVVGGVRSSAVTATACAVGMPILVELALFIDGPIERALSRRYVEAARERLLQIAPVVVAITGSYGKTSTKRFVEHLVAGSRSVVASPRSFNNRAGLARAVNESLASGTEVFVAEMGTYGTGEIRDLVRWLSPTVSAVTAIGPVHLERFGSLDTTLEAKSEIFEGATVAILNVDDEKLSALAPSIGHARILRCSVIDRDADVALIESDGVAELYVGGSRAGTMGLDEQRPVPLSNVTIAVAIALALDIPNNAIVERLSSLPKVDHRLSIGEASSGVVVLDDTYNANPAGAELALRGLFANKSAGARSVVVTPGMVELGPIQAKANFEFARNVATAGAELVVVGSTNRRSLLAGYRSVAQADQSKEAIVVAKREDAVAWVRKELGPGDVVLYENDLPDHYP